VHAVVAAFPDINFVDWSGREPWLPHMLQCAIWIEHAELFTYRAAFLLTQTAGYLIQRERYEEAEPICLRALAISMQQKDAKHIFNAQQSGINLVLAGEIRGSGAVIKACPGNPGTAVGTTTSPHGYRSL